MDSNNDRDATSGRSAVGVDRWLHVSSVVSEDRSPMAAGAGPDRIGELEMRLGFALDDTHRRYLGGQDGWEPAGRAAALAGPFRIASVKWLHTSPRTFSGPVLEELTGSSTARKLRDIGVSFRNYLVVAVDPWVGASYLMPVREGRAGPEVVTVAGWVEQDTFVGDIYSSFSDFLAHRADSAARNWERVLAQEAWAEHARRVWHAEPALSVFGPPDDDGVLATAIVDLLASVVEIQPVEVWRLTGRRWDGSAGDLERILATASRSMPDGTERLFLGLQGRLASGGSWQVTVTRSRPSAPKDQVLVLLRTMNREDQPALGQIEALIARAVAQLSPTCVTGSSLTANRKATELGISQPAGFRVWLPDNQVPSAVEGGDVGELTVTKMGRGLLLSAPDHWTPEQAVTEVHALVARLTRSRPQP